MANGAPREGADTTTPGVTIRVDGPMVETIGHGFYTTDDIAAAIQAIKDHPSFRAPALLLIDVRVRAVHHSFEDIRVRLALIDEQLRPRRVAFVATGEAREGLARIYQSRAAGHLPVEVFSDPDAAREWLREALPRPGDTLVVAKSGRQCDVYKLAAGGLWEPLRRDFTDQHVAWSVARARLAPDGHQVWYRLEREPDAAIRPY